MSDRPDARSPEVRLLVRLLEIHRASSGSTYRLLEHHDAKLKAASGDAENDRRPSS